VLLTWVRLVLYWLLWVCFRTFFWLLTGLRVEGAEHLPASGPVLVASNHLNNFDPLILDCVLRRPVAWLAKIELFRAPALAAFLRLFWTIPLDRGGADRQALRAALDRLARGQVLAIFPEGTRSRAASMRRGLVGVGMLAVRSGAPILPIGIAGSERPLRLWPRPVVTVRIGRPITIERVPGQRPDYQAITDQIMAEIAALVPPAYRGVYAQADRLEEAAPAAGAAREEAAR
jgi:1-acyl-sn-glycerol-3-phosphate acyltransferase